MYKYYITPKNGPLSPAILDFKFASSCIKSRVLPRVVYTNNFSVTSHCPGNVRSNIDKRNAGSQSDGVKRDTMINFMLTWHRLSFLIGQFKVKA